MPRIHHFLHINPTNCMFLCVPFLQVHGLQLRAYDVLFPLSQLAHRRRKHGVMTEAGLVELVVDIVESWKVRQIWSFGCVMNQKVSGA